MFSRDVTTYGTTWQSKLQYLQEYRQRSKKYIDAAPGLAPVLEDEYRQEREKVAGYIMSGVVGEFTEAKQAYLKARSKMGAARVAESARFDYPKLVQEKQAILTTIEQLKQRGYDPLSGGQDPAEKLEELYAELMAGPLERQRAAVEVFEELPTMGFKGTTKSGMEVRYALVDLAVKAKAEIPNLRVTDEMLSAHTALEQAKAELLAKHEQLADVGLALGEGGFNEKSQLYRPGGAEDPGQNAMGPLADAWRQVAYRQVGAGNEILEVSKE